MPQLDVSFMTVDPMLADVFNVRRRLDAVSDKGRAAVTTDQVIPNVRGVVTQGDSELTRAENGQTMTKEIVIVTRFALQGPAIGPRTQGNPAYQPDIIEWDGTSYVVTSVEPYRRFGAGTYQVKAASMTTIDRTPS